MDNALSIVDGLTSVETGYVSDFALETLVASSFGVHAVTLYVEARGESADDISVTAEGAPDVVCDFAVAQCRERAVERFLAWERG